MRSIAAGFARAFAALALSAFAAQAADFKLLSSWTPNNKGTWITEEMFAKDVEAATGGRVKIQRSGPEVVSPFEQLEPTSAGVFSFLITHGAYHYGATGIGMALDAVAADPDKRRAAGLMEAVDKHYAKHNLKVVALVPQGDSGYHIMLRQPIGEKGDFSGRKIRGTQVYHPLISKLGGSPVVLPGNEIYPALEKGVIDGAAWPTVGALDLRFYEVAKYYVRPSFGVSTLLIFANLDAWSKISPADQAAVLEVGKKVEKHIYSVFDKMADDEAAELRKRGVQETKPSPENVAKMNGYWMEGVWDLVKKKNGAEADSLLKLVMDKKLGL
ncbi:MAG: dctP 8 [Hyphomicrobiales bacterium]|nr:dctP 8 [Hyphomicrobiales bacterium]